jgi:outer membrane receptor protein involved in Fe transport
MEYSGVKTQLLQTNEINDRSYANFFPTLHLTYDLADQNAVQLSYSRRIRRPRFWDLNPFFTFSDSRNQFSGNPNIDPEFTGSYEANHIKYWENGSLTSGIFYRHTTDVIERITTYDNEGNSFTKPENLSNRNDYGLEFTGSFDPLKFWRINGDLNFFRSITNGENLGQSFDADTYTWFGRFTSKLTLWKKLDVQTTFNYRAPRKTTQGENKAMYNADLGMSIDVLKNNGTLTLSSRDLFNTRRWRHTSEGENFYTRGDFQWHSRSISLTLNYRLNQKKQRDQEGPKGEGTAPDNGGMEF